MLLASRVPVVANTERDWIADRAVNPLEPLMAKAAIQMTRAEVDRDLGEIMVVALTLRGSIDSIVKSSCSLGRRRQIMQHYLRHFCLLPAPPVPVGSGE